MTTILIFLAVWIVLSAAVAAMFTAMVAAVEPRGRK